jgi:hypothetical protein
VCNEATLPCTVREKTDKDAQVALDVKLIMAGRGGQRETRMHRGILALLLAVTLAPVASAQTGKHLAIGAGIAAQRYADSDFSAKNPSISFVYRITLKPEVKQGWSWEPKIDFGWFTVDTDMEVGGINTRIGRSRAGSIMLGVERSYRAGPWKVGVLGVVGPSFNHFDVDAAARKAYHDRLERDLTSIEVKNSIAVRPELSGWYDLNQWSALHASLSYMINRPAVETTAGGVTTSTTWKTDHLSAQIGIVVGVF